jgi:hypothetical protein
MPQLKTIGPIFKDQEYKNFGFVVLEYGTTIRCVTSQKSLDLIYFVAEACNHSFDQTASGKN